MRLLVQLIGGLALITLVISAWLFARPRFQAITAEPLPQGLKGHVLAMELVKTASEVTAIVGPPGHANRATMRIKIQRDWSFIVAYGLLFFFVSLFLGLQDSIWARWLGLSAGVVALLGVFFDVVENNRILRVLTVAPAELTDQLAFEIREAALLKWGLIFIAMLLLAPAFLFQRGWVRWIGVVFLLCAVIGLIGLWHNPALELAALLMGVGLLLLIGLLFLPRAAWPENYDSSRPRYPARAAVSSSDRGN